MLTPISKLSKSIAALPTDCSPLLAEIRVRVQTARIKAGLMANRDLLALYWDIGRLILARQKKAGGGKCAAAGYTIDEARKFAPAVRSALC